MNSNWNSRLKVLKSDLKLTSHKIACITGINSYSINNVTGKDDAKFSRTFKLVVVVYEMMLERLKPKFMIVDKDKMPYTVYGVYSSFEEASKNLDNDQLIKQI